LTKYVVISVSVIVIVGMIYGVKHSANVQPDFWKSFVPGLWANIIGVSVAAIIGVPVGFAINHYVVRITERRHHDHQVAEVRQLLEQVRLELNLHFATLSRLSQSFTAIKTGTAVPLGVDVSTLVLQDIFGRQFIGNHSVLDIGESLALFHLSAYYARVEELNRLLAWRIQDTQHPETWDRRIADLTDSVSLARVQAEYETQQVVARLTGREN